MIMLISVDALDGIVLFKVVFDEEVENFHVYRDLRETNKDTASDFLMCNLIEPGMLADVRYLIALFWVSVQYVRDQVSRLLGDKLGDLIVTI